MDFFSPEHIRIADFSYDLPDERIARHPLEGRDGCLLLHSRQDGRTDDHLFTDLPVLLASSEGNLKRGMMVFNNTRVIHARILFRRPSGAYIEVFLLEPLSPNDYVLMFQTRHECEWSCMVGNLKKWKDEYLERELQLPSGLKTRLRAYLGDPCGGNARRIRFEWDGGDTFASVLESAGSIPIPPYLKRGSEQSDELDYQTVYSKIKGSVAAPTAGLHFTDSLLSRLADDGVDVREVTLHVGAGTFQPVKSEEIGDHPMHTETFCVDADILQDLVSQLEEESARKRGVLTAVGTTSVRTLETLPYLGRIVEERVSANMPVGPLHLGQWEAYKRPVSRVDAIRYIKILADYAAKEGGSLQASTAIMIAPGFKWNVVGRMVTNFHQPSSTLLLLVSSFLEPYRYPGDGMGELQWQKLYRHALDGKYRFLSYGDACLLERRAGGV